MADLGFFPGRLPWTLIVYRNRDIYHYDYSIDVGEPESTNDKEILKAIKLFYEDMLKKYGQPDNDLDVIRPHLADWIENNPGKISSSNDTWQLTEKTVLTLSVGVLGDRVRIIFSYRQNEK